MLCILGVSMVSFSARRAAWSLLRSTTSASTSGPPTRRPPTSAASATSSSAASGTSPCTWSPTTSWFPPATSSSVWSATKATSLRKTNFYTLWRYLDSSQFPIKYIVSRDWNELISKVDQNCFNSFRYCSITKVKLGSGNLKLLLCQLEPAVSLFNLVPQAVLRSWSQSGTFFILTFTARSKPAKTKDKTKFRVESPRQRDLKSPEPSKQAPVAQNCSQIVF